MIYQPRYFLQRLVRIDLQYFFFFVAYHTQMDELRLPERALLVPSRPNKAESNDHENILSPHYLSESRNRPLRHPYLIQRFLSFFILEAPSLPVTNTRDIRDSRLGEDIALHYSRWNSQRTLFGHTISSNPPNVRENRGPHGRRAEEQGPGVEPEFVVKDRREAIHNARKNALANKLQSMLGDDTDAFVLLCLGKEYECSIIPVSISDPADETIIWREIRHVWRSRRGWRRYVSFLSVNRVDLVEVCKHRSFH